MKRYTFRSRDSDRARTNRAWLRRALGILILAALLAVSSAGSVAAASPVTITVRENEYVQPAAEMLGTDTYPDIISLEGGGLVATVIPNRGRALWDLVADGEPLLFATGTPMPHMGEDGRYSLEFGGLYFSVPWNVRDNQPADLEYTLNRAEGTVHLRGTDSETGVEVEKAVRIDPDLRRVTVEFQVTNAGNASVHFPLRATLLVGPNDLETRDSQVLFPVATVTIGPNDGWMGSPGTEVSWPAPWSRWSQFEGAGGFTGCWAGTAEASEPSVTVTWPQLAKTLRVNWSPPERFGQARVEAFGLSYQDVLGGEPYWRLILEQPGGAPVELAPEEALAFVLTLTVEP